MASAASGHGGSPRPAKEVADYFHSLRETYQVGYSGNGDGDEVRIHAPMFTFLDLRRLRRQGWDARRITGSEVSVVKVVARPIEEAEYGR